MTVNFTLLTVYSVRVLGLFTCTAHTSYTRTCTSVYMYLDSLHVQHIQAIHVHVHQCTCTWTLYIYSTYKLYTYMYISVHILGLFTCTAHTSYTHTCTCISIY